MEIREQSALTRSGECRNQESNTLSRIATLSNLATSLSDPKLVGLDVVRHLKAMVEVLE